MSLRVVLTNRGMYTIHLGKTGLFIIVSIVVFTIFIDTSITRIYAFTGLLTSHTFNILVFSGVTIVYLIGQHCHPNRRCFKKSADKKSPNFICLSNSNYSAIWLGGNTVYGYSSDVLDYKLQPLFFQDSSVDKLWYCDVFIGTFGGAILFVVQI